MDDSVFSYIKEGRLVSVSYGLFLREPMEARPVPCLPYVVVKKKGAISACRQLLAGVSAAPHRPRPHLAAGDGLGSVPRRLHSHICSVLKSLLRWDEENIWLKFESNIYFHLRKIGIDVVKR
ncbi:hypothetical protein E2C01_013385 [Portunus trituberculatus]|uniref:Uncharacterized protein n=1 Tax=Portunus trituberculatus TaxID=210409 RepID=A0A5B7DG41_PORTR|nr:hypothetical protein [Portunus trituberculatus]